MNVLIIICLIIVAIICWCFIDYKLGRKEHLSRSKYTKFPLRKSAIELFTDGENLYKDLFDSIRNSKSSIHILFYIVKNDKISEEFLTLLSDKAGQGIEVRLFLDYIGSFQLKKKKIQQLKNSGVMVSQSHKPRFPYFFYTLQARNHRKITVIDGKISYLGGFNIGKEYLGLDPKFGFWRDYHLKVEGEGAFDLQQQFLKDWYDSTGVNDLDFSKYQPTLKKGSIEQMFISTYGEHLQDHFTAFIRNAKQEIIICSPYFIPGREILNELLNALSNGVQVKIMVPLKPDHPLVMEASFPYFKKLLVAGCEIYRFHYGFYHSKVIVIDDNLCDIGTANFDKRSMYLNDEMNCLIYDREFIQNVKEHIYKDFRHSELLTYEAYKNRPFSQRGKEILATIVSHFL